MKNTEKKSPVKTIIIIIVLVFVVVCGAAVMIAAPIVFDTVSDAKKSSYKIMVSGINNRIISTCMIESEPKKTVYVFNNGEVNSDIDLSSFDLPDSGIITIDTDCNTTIDVKYDKIAVKKTADSDEIEIIELKK